MNKNLNKKGASKKKGAAESDYLSEAGDVAAETAQKNEGAPPRKKGAAQGNGSWDALINLGDTQYEKQQKKGEEKTHNTLMSGMYDSIVKSRKDNSAIKTYGADYGQPNSSGEFTREKGVVEQTPDQLKAYKDWAADQGAKRMGFTQDFGAARQNSYAKGAAKVNSIMNYGGAAKAKGAAEYGGKKGDESKSHLDYEE